MEEQLNKVKDSYEHAARMARFQQQESAVNSGEAESTPKAMILDHKLVSLDRDTSNRDLEVVNNSNLAGNHLLQP